MIDIKKLIEAIENNVNGLTERQIRQIVDVLEMQDKWIPCSERLPEPIRPVLVTVKNWMNDKPFVRMGRFHTNHWEVEGCVVENSKILAWQPLPDPYKKEGAEDECN